HARHRRDLRQGRSHGSPAPGARPEDRQVPRHHRTLPARVAHRGHPSPPIRHHPNGGERRRSAPLQFLRSALTAGGRKADGHHRHEGSRPRTHPFYLDASAIDEQKHSWEGMVLAPTPGTLKMREAMYYSLSLPVSTVIIGCDSIPQLEENVQFARDFTPFNQKQMTELTARAEPVSKQSLFFRFYDRA